MIKLANEVAEQRLDHMKAISADAGLTKELNRRLEYLENYAAAGHDCGPCGGKGGWVQMNDQDCPQVTHRYPFSKPETSTGPDGYQECIECKGTGYITTKNRTECRMWADHDKDSMYFEMYQLYKYVDGTGYADEKLPEPRFWFNGGLIFHGDSWGIHT